MGEAKKASPALQALIDLSNVEIAPEQEQDPNLRVVMEMLRASLERPAWEHVRAESAEIKTLRSQFFSLKIPDGIVLRRRKNQGSLSSPGGSPYASCNQVTLLLGQQAKRHRVMVSMVHRLW